MSGDAGPPQQLNAVVKGKVIRALRVCLRPLHLRRTASIALIIGTWLTLFNQGDVMLSGGLKGWVWGKIALNYLTPFVVANAGLLSVKR